MGKKHLRLTVHGTVYGERCSIGLSASGDDQWLTFSLANANDFLAQAEPDTLTYLNAVKGYCGAAVKWQGLSVRQYNDAGVLQTVGERTFATEVTSTAAAGLPGFVAAVHTLMTDTPGRQNRGRFYLPISAPGSMAQNGRLNVKAELALAAKNWINALNNAPGIDAIVGGYKTVVHSNVLNGHQTPVSKVRVGDVPDAQRRRNNEMVEAFALETISNP